MGSWGCPEVNLISTHRAFRPFGVTEPLSKIRTPRPPRSAPVDILAKVLSLPGKPKKPA